MSGFSASAKGLVVGLACASGLFAAACNGGGNDDEGAPPPGGGGTPTTWTTRAAGVGGAVKSVARSPTKFVALTDGFVAGETVLVSDDGHSWVKPASTRLLSDEAVTFGNGLFVAVGTAGLISTSPDGLEWTARSDCGAPACLDKLLAVAWSGSAFAAVGEKGMVFTSGDGVSWSARATPFGAGQTQFQSVASSGQAFVAAGRRGDALGGAIAYSNDGGASWLEATVAPASGYEFYGVAWDGRRFLATSSGGIWASADGASFSQLTANTIHRLTPTADGYVGTNGVGNVKTSADAVTWADAYNFTYPSISQLLYLPERGEYLAAGGDSAGGFIATSSDATTWRARFTSDEMTAIVWDGGRFLAIDLNGRLYTSADGLGWASTGLIPNSESLRRHADVAWSGSRYVAVASGGKIISSADGVAWAEPALYNAITSFVSVTWAGAEFAAVTSDGQFYRSADGVAWPALGTPVGPGARLNDLAWSGALGRYVAVGEAGNVYVSDGGSAWAARPSAAPRGLRSVIWADSQFVAVGDSGTIVTSPDGGDWAEHSVAGGPTLNAVALLNGELVAVGDGGHVFVSGDGVAWAEQATDTTVALSALAASPSRAVAVGAEGRIVSRP